MRLAARVLVALLGGVWLATSAPAREVQRWQAAPYHSAVHVADVANRGLSEVSGLAASRLRDDLLWAVNDSGGKARLYAFGLDGRDRGCVRVEGAMNRDWEDLASFRLDGGAYLLIADVGDNGAKRRTSVLYAVAEPPIRGEKLGKNAEVPVSWTLRFRYEDGSRDCEAVAVDAAGGRILLLTKRRFPSALYELPLAERGRDGVALARRVTEVPHLPRPSSRWWPLPGSGKRSLRRLGSFATAMDLAADGSAAAVLTYGDAFLFSRSGGESWAEAFARSPRRIALPRLRQAEALTFVPDGHTLYVTSEGRRAPLLRLDPEDRATGSQSSARE
jgi:hypothetical protein